MRRSTKRKEYLPSFSCDVSQLETLLNNIKEHFGDTDVDISIYINLKNEKYNFDDVSEIRSNIEKLPAQVTQFSIYFRERFRSCSIDAGGPFSPAEVSVESDSEAWSAGITEICKDFTQRHRCWYYIVNKIPIYWTFFVLLFLPLNALVWLGKKISISTYLVYGWILALISIGILAFARKYVFPSAIVILKEKKATWRQYVPEISLFIALLSIVVAIIGLFIQIFK